MKNKIKILFLVVFSICCFGILTACPPTECKGPEGVGQFDAPLSVSYDLENCTITWSDVIMNCSCENARYGIYMAMPNESDFVKISTNNWGNSVNANSIFERLSTEQFTIGTYRFKITTLAHGDWTESELSEETAEIEVNEIKQGGSLTDFNVVVNNRYECYLQFNGVPKAGYGVRRNDPEYSNSFMFLVITRADDLGNVGINIGYSLYKEGVYTFIITPDSKATFKNGVLCILNASPVEFEITIEKSESLKNDSVTDITAKDGNLSWEGDGNVFLINTWNGSAGIGTTETGHNFYYSFLKKGIGSKTHQITIVSAGGFISYAATSANAGVLTVYGDSEAKTVTVKT